MADKIILNPTAEEMIKLFTMAQDNPNIEVSAQYIVTTLPKEVDTNEAMKILGCSKRSITNLIKKEVLTIARKKGKKNLFDREKLLEIKELNII